MASRRLQLVLDLDTGGYSGRLVKAGSEMRAFSGTVQSSSRALAKHGKGFEDFSNVAKRPLGALRENVMLMGNLRLAYLAVSGVVGGLVGAMVKQSAEVERLQVLMKGLSKATTEAGRAAEASKNIEVIFDMSRRNAVAVKDLTDAFVKMKSGGVDPLKGNLENLTDAVAYFGGTSETMHRASIAIQQMAGKGVISMEELRQQLGEAVPTAMNDMAVAMGMQLQAFTKLVSKGKVQAKPALELMFREFDLMYRGAGERMANTLTGQWSIFQTNLTQLSTLFTGQQRQDIETQRRLYEDGKISWQQYRAALEPVQGGLFQQIAAGMKEVNAALNSSEARASMAGIGQEIGSAAATLGSMIRTAIEWRTEIWAGIKAVTAAFLFMKGVKIAQWFYDIGYAAISGLRNAGTITNEIGDKLTGLGTKLERSSKYWDLMIQRQGNYLNATRATISTTTSRISQLTQEHAGQQALAADYARNIALLERQRLEQVQTLNTARTLHNANIALGRASTASLAAESAAAAALNRTDRALAATKGQLARTNQIVAATQAELALATDVVAAAVTREEALVVSSTLALRAQAVAAGIAAAATTAFGAAVNIALGPVGIIAGLLLSAAYAAGVFENSADKAADAAVRLAQGIADLEAVKAMQHRNDMLRDKNDGLNSFQARALAAISPDYAKKRDQMMSDNNAEIERNNRLINYGKRSLQKEGASQFARQRMDGMDDRLSRWSTRYQDERARFDRSKQTPADVKRLDAARNRAEQGEAGERARYLSGYQKLAADARKNGDLVKAQQYDEVVRSLKAATEATHDYSVSQDGLRTAAVGAGNAVGAGGKHLTDAEKAANKAATAYESAREKYKNMIADQTGQIAQLEDEANGGEGALAKFNAQLAAGRFPDALPGEIAAMRVNFEKIDKLNEQADWTRAIKQLRKEVIETTAAANGMWFALEMDRGTGALDEYKRIESVKARFADKIEAAKGDKGRLKELNDEIARMVANLNRIDLAEATDNWRKQAEDIANSLLDENAQREANYKRELERQQKLLALAVDGTEEKRLAEEAFAKWKAAADAKFIRESENGVVKMARDWANLGAGIDQAMTGALDGFVNSMADGQFNFAEFTKSLVKDLLKIILKAMIAYAILSAIGAVGNSATKTNADGTPAKMGFGEFMKTNMNKWAGGFTPNVPQAPAGVTPSAGTPIVPPRQATGGWMGMPLKPGEIPIIGHEGEVVLNKQQQAFYADRLAGGAGGMPNVSVNVINNSGHPLDAEQGKPEFNGKEMIVSVVVEAAQKQGPLRDVLSQVAKNG